MKFGRSIPTPIRIMPTDSHGFIVDVGFATFACETSESVIRVLEAYLLWPTSFIKDIEDVRDRETSINKNTTQSVMPPCPEGPKLKSPQF